VRRGLGAGAVLVLGAWPATTRAAGFFPALVASTVRAATVVAAGGAAAPVVSPRVAALTEGVVKAMFFRKLKIAALLFLVIAGSGAGLVLALAGRPHADAAGVVEQPAPRERPGPGADPGMPIRSLPGHTDRLTSVAYSTDGTLIATAAWDCTARVWDARTGTEVRRLEFPATKGHGTFSQIALSPDKAFVVTLARESTDKWVVLVWDRRTGEKVRAFPAEGGSFALSPDGGLIACGGYRAIGLYELATGKLVREIHGDEKQLAIMSLTFSPDGKTLLSTGHPPTPQRGDGVFRLTIMPDVLRVWDVATGKERPSTLNGLVLGAHFFGQRLAFSPDGRTVAHASRRDISLRETATGGERARLTGHADDVCAVAFSPDGRTLASGGMDGTVRLWDLPPGKEVGRFGKQVDPFKGGWVLAVAFSPDGRTLVSGGLNKTAENWDVSRITGRPRTPAGRSPAELEADWRDLAGDAAAGYAALGRLVASPGRTVPFLGKQLQSAKPVDARRIERLIADLDDGQFQVREQATRELEALAERAEPALRQARAGKPSAEARRRLDALLDRLDGARPSAETAREIRAVEALEWIGSPEARRLLDQLAAGPAEARLTREAREAAGRLARRAPVAP
jgi:WD40 repeat protein